MARRAALARESSRSSTVGEGQGRASPWPRSIAGSPRSRPPDEPGPPEPRPTAITAASRRRRRRPAGSRSTSADASRSTGSCSTPATTTSTRSARGSASRSGSRSRRRTTRRSGSGVSVDRRPDRPRTSPNPGLAPVAFDASSLVGPVRPRDGDAAGPPRRTITTSRSPRSRSSTRPASNVAQGRQGLGARHDRGPAPLAAGEPGRRRLSARRLGKSSPGSTNRREALIRDALDEPARQRFDEATRDRSPRSTAELAALPRPATGLRRDDPQRLGAFRGTGPDGGKPRAIRVLGAGRRPQPAGRSSARGRSRSSPGVPARFDLPPDAPEGERRAALARWLTDPRNPLTWRSIVNRVWQYHFGRGLVDSPNDFGRMGRTPVASRAARLARGRVPRRRAVAQGAASADRHQRRLPAIVRRRTTAEGHDRRRQRLALADEPAQARGRGGPRCGAGRGRQARPDDGRAGLPRLRGRASRALAALRVPALRPGGPRRRYRRSVYRFIVRSQPQPFMTALDCADPSMQRRQAERERSPPSRPWPCSTTASWWRWPATSPRGSSTGRATSPTRIDRAFRLALGRPPTPDGTRGPGRPCPASSAWRTPAG